MRLIRTSYNFAEQYKDHWVFGRAVNDEVVWTIRSKYWITGCIRSLLKQAFWKG